MGDFEFFRVSGVPGGRDFHKTKFVSGIGGLKILVFLAWPQLGPFFVLKFLRSRGLSSTVSKVRSDCKVLFEQKNGPLIAVNSR